MKDWSLYEVFIRSKKGLQHIHVGSLNAPNEELALQYARDLYTRRNEGVSIWVIPSKSIIASDPNDNESFFEPSKDKIYRHPSFYKLPKNIKNI